MASVRELQVARLTELRNLAECAQAKFGNRLERLDPISKNNPSRLAVSIYAESMVHLNVTAATFNALYRELLQWVSEMDHHAPDLLAEPAPGDVGEATQQAIEQARKIHGAVDEMTWNLAIHSLERCVEVAGVSEMKEFLELARLIAEKTARLFGWEYVNLAIELIKMIEESEETWNIRDIEARKAGKVLAALELFMYSTLEASQYAVAQVHSLTRAESRIDFDKSLDEGGRCAMGQAKAFVMEKVAQARRGMPDSWLRFPQDGFWLEAPTFAVPRQDAA